MRALGVIPARAGSKGVPGKNLRQVAGASLLAWAVEAARASRRLAATVLTTDGEEIARAGRELGCEVIARPAELARDETPMAPVVRHALDQAEAEHGRFDAVVLLQPTSPIRTGADVDAVLALLEEDPETESVVSVCPADDEHPARMYRLDAGGRMEPLWPEWETTRRQDLPPVYLRNGALYAVRRDVLVERGVLVGERRRAYVMPRELLANVDDERDLALAEVLVRRWKKGLC